MTGFVVKVRGGGRILREFRCPEHGVFESYDPGEEQPCPESIDIATFPWQPAYVDGAWRCGLPSERCFATAPLGRVKLGEVTRGKVEEAPGPAALDTRPLAEGMSTSEFKARRRKFWADRRRAEFKAKIG